MGSEPDLSEFISLSSTRNKPCPIPGALEQLEPEEAARLVSAIEAVSGGTVTHAAVRDWLSRRQIDTTWQAVRSHVNKECSCARGS